MDYFKRFINYVQQHRVQQHLLFWLFIVLVNIPSGLLEGDTLWDIFTLNFCLHIPQAMATYLFAYIIIPHLVLKKKYILSSIVFIFSTYCIAVLARILVVHVGEELVRLKPFEQEPISEIFRDIRKLFEVYIPTIYVTVFQFLFLKYFKDYRKSKDKEILLSKEKAEAELKILKAQLNPHFLFNTLNNIYSLAIDNSPKTPVAIGKLSEILDHVLYQCNKPFVSLSSEINLLKNHIELEKLRYDERLEVHLETTIERDIDIPPLLLLSLLENAFKHGASEDSGSPKILITILQKDNTFKFEISNTVALTYKVQNKAAIGLANIRKQLDLIYAAHYKLDIETSVSFFKVVLHLKNIKVDES